MCGKPKADNSAVVQEQQSAAADAAAKEAARQSRLSTGLASIKAAFEGSPTYTTQSTPYDWSTFTRKATGPFTTAADLASPYNTPAGYTAVQVAPKGSSGGTAAASPGSYASAMSFVPNPHYGERGQQNPSIQVNTPGAGSPFAGGGGGSVWALRGPDGQIHYQGDAFNVDNQVQTGASGGFDDAFYNKYKQAVLDYYMPQVDKQYKDAKNELTYRLARSGNLLSSAANTNTADLVNQNDINQSQVRNKADQAAGDLRTQVAGEEQKAVNQLYATEDPTLAADTATNAVRDISLSTPDLSPAGALFDVASIGGANILKGYQSQQLANAFKTALSSGGSGRNQRNVRG
jgi:hypothetical protein